MSGMADDLKLRLNQAAEAATPKAKKLFGDAITAKAEFKPIANASLADVGAVNGYDKMMGPYKSLPFVPDVKPDLTNHVLEKAIAGMFLYLGKEKAAIRETPAKRTTDLLNKVFAKYRGSNGSVYATSSELRRRDGRRRSFCADE